MPLIAMHQPPSIEASKRGTPYENEAFSYNPQTNTITIKKHGVYRITSSPPVKIELDAGDEIVLSE